MASAVNPMLEWLRGHLKVDIQHLALTRENLTNLQSYMSSYATAGPLQCNFDAAFEYLNKCDGDPNCSLYAAVANGKYHGFMMIRHGLRPDLRWMPSPEAAHQPFPGFWPQADDFDMERVTDILVLCSHGGPRGLGQLLVLWALALSQHGVFLQLSIRIETMTTDFSDDPSAIPVGSKYLVMRHAYLDAAQHIYSKFGFRPVKVLNNHGGQVGGIFYYRREPLTRRELTRYLSHLQSSGVVVDVPADESAEAMARPDAFFSDDWPSLRAGMAVQALSGSDMAPLDLEYHDISFDENGAMRSGADLLNPDTLFSAPAETVWGVGGMPDEEGVTWDMFPGAGTTHIGTDMVYSDHALNLAIPAQVPHQDHDVDAGPILVPPPTSRTHKKNKQQREREHRQADESSSEDPAQAARHRGRRIPSELVCPECGREFTKMSNLNRHLRTGHNVSRRRDKYVEPRPGDELGLVPDKYKCPKCGKSFPHRLDNLKRHMERSHTEEKDARRQVKKNAVCSEDEACEFKCRDCEHAMFTGHRAYSNWIRHRRVNHGVAEAPRSRAVSQA